MINKDIIEKTKRTKRLSLSRSQFFKHYYISLIPLIPMGFIIYDEPSTLKGFGIWIFLFVSISLFLFQRKRLLFKKFNADCTTDELKDAFKRASNELEWKIEKTETEFLQAYSNDPLNYYGGNIIIVIPTDGGFLINSLSDPRYQSIPFISTWDKQNIKTFVSHLKDVINKKEENRDYLVPEKEWTTKRIITRIIVYPFLLLVIGLSLKLIIEPISVRSGSAGVSGLVIGIGYFVIDIKNILNRKKYERTTKAHMQ